jgi:hypothetical protein
MDTTMRGQPNAMLKRAVKAALVLLVISSGSYLWHKVSSDNIALRAEQARQTALRMTPRKLAVLEREAARDAAAQAFAEQQAAERQARAEVEQQTPMDMQRATSPTKG